MTPDVAVVHLVRAANGPKPLRRFLESYVAHAAGCPHDLVLLCKGFERGALPDEIIDAIGSVAHTTVHVPDTGVDIDAYRAGIDRIPHAYLCFLNSYSRVLADHWLGKLMAVARRPGVGLVGATGSAESMSSALEALGSRGIKANVVDALLLRRWRFARDFPSFPNYAVRTNGFVIRRDLFVELCPPRIGRKRAAYRFESGRWGLTRLVQARGLEVFVVGKDGAYPPGDWARSGGFRQGRQSNLLIADNQTDRFADADQATRERLASLAWGDPSLAQVDE
jgi:hypothetical protein